MKPSAYTSLMRVLAALLLGFALLAAQQPVGPNGAASPIGASAPVGIDGELRVTLVRDLKFSGAELMDLQRGRVVRHAIGTTIPGEVAVAAGVRIHASKTVFLELFRDIERFKRSEDVLQIGRFSNPPKASDLDALTVGRDDFDPKHCKVRDCGIRLSAELINRLNGELDLTASDVQAQGEQFFKQTLFDSVNAYWSGRPDRMTQYDDGDQPIRPLDAFQALLKGATAIGALVPGLPAHLADFPRSHLEGVEDFLYWSKEKFGIAPFITTTHMTILCPSVRTCIATSKDVYSSRYFDASLGLTIASDDLANPDGSFYLFYANSSRANALKGGLGGLRRSIVERRARGSLDESLRRIKSRMEQRR